jgi:hypothetical protein
MAGNLFPKKNRFNIAMGADLALFAMTMADSKKSVTDTDMLLATDTANEHLL